MSDMSERVGEGCHRNQILRVCQGGLHEILSRKPLEYPSKRLFAPH